MNYISNYTAVTPTFDTDKVLQNVTSLFRTGLWTKYLRSQTLRIILITFKGEYIWCFLYCGTGWCDFLHQYAYKQVYRFL